VNPSHRGSKQPKFISEAKGAKFESKKIVNYSFSYPDHQTIARELQANVFFAHPYSSWERGTNENSNGLIRQYFPE